MNPPSGATYLIDPTLRREFQTLPLRVVAATPGTIEWQVAGRVVGSSSSEAALMWPLSPESTASPRATSAGGLRRARWW